MMRRANNNNNYRRGSKQKYIDNCRDLLGWGGCGKSTKEPAAKVCLCLCVGGG